MASQGISYPACAREVISVGAVYDAHLDPVPFSMCSDSTMAPDQLACYSNSSALLDLLAPGHCARTAELGGGVETCFGGTSAAAPFVAGVVALMLENQPEHTPATIDAMLKREGEEVRDPRNNLLFPRVDASRAVVAPLPVLHVELPASSGTVVSEPPGIECQNPDAPEGCRAVFEPGTTVVLSVFPSPDQIFVGWYGDAACEDGVVTLEQSQSCVAVFADAMILRDDFDLGGTTMWQ